MVIKHIGNYRGVFAVLRAQAVFGLGYYRVHIGKIAAVRRGFVYFNGVRPGFIGYHAVYYQQFAAFVYFNIERLNAAAQGKKEQENKDSVHKITCKKAYCQKFGRLVVAPRMVRQSSG